jgi:hypothetical protein
MSSGLSALLRHVQLQAGQDIRLEPLLVISEDAKAHAETKRRRSCHGEALEALESGSSTTKCNRPLRLSDRDHCHCQSDGPHRTDGQSTNVAGGWGPRPNSLSGDMKN